MAKTNTSNTEKKNSNRQPSGTMPKDKLARHKLKGNISYTERVVSGGKRVKKFAESIKHYRQFVHGVNEPSLASSLRQTAHYFSIPMSRADSDNPRDRKGLEVPTTEQASE